MKADDYSITLNNSSSCVAAAAAGTTASTTTPFTLAQPINVTLGSRFSVLGSSINVELTFLSFSLLPSPNAYFATITLVISVKWVF